MQSARTISLQTKIPRAIYLARLRSYMLHLIQDPNDGNYLLLETVGPNTAYLYRTPNTERCWLPLSALPTTVRTRDESPENFSSWIASTDYKAIYANRTKAGILKFIDKHPELFI